MSAGAPPAPAQAALPIRQYAEEIVKAVRENDVVVIIGETGSGKTTQLSQVRMGAGWRENGRVTPTKSILLMHDFQPARRLISTRFPSPHPTYRFSWRLALARRAS